MKEFLQQPGFLGFYGNIGADLSTLLGIFFAVLFLIGWYQARKRLGNHHHWLVLGGMVMMLAYFSSYYLFRQLGVLAFEGREGFGGSDFMYTYIFSPLLVIHILLVSIGLVMAIYLIILGFRAVEVINGQRVLKSQDLRARGKTLLTVLGVCGGALFLIFLIRTALSEFTMRRMIVYLSGALLVGLILCAEKGIEKLLPNGERRHRILGRITMVMYATIMFTGTVTYIMVYVLYPPHIK